MLNYIRFHNLRAFHDSGKVTIDPLTILVGKNSSGKSTIARFLPLLRQSVEVSTRGPILWFGNKYVDFGSFETAIRAGANENKITFELGMLSQRSYLSGLRQSESPESKEINISLDLVEEQKSTKLQSFHINSNDLSISVDIIDNQANVTVNKRLITQFKFNVANTVDFGLLPELDLELDDSYLAEEGTDRYSRKFEIRRMLITELSDKILNDNLVDETSTKIYNELINHYDLSFRSYVNRFKNLGQKYHVFKPVSDFSDENFRSIWMSSLVINIPNIITEINQLIDAQMRRITYVAPVRASAERFYRFQDLQVKELDHTGSNLAMLLHSLSSRQFKDFRHWVKKNLRFEIDVDLDGSHYAILVKPEGYKNYHNLSDMGFGFSQILPVVVSIWMGARTDLASKFVYQNQNIFDRVIVIEQPELHLHPEMQDVLAATIVSVASSYSKIKVKFLIETHSKTFIDAIGRCIRKGLIEESLISINIVEHKVDSDTSEVSKSYFDKNGQLHQWPLGFFST